MRWRIENVVLAVSLALVGAAVGGLLLMRKVEQATTFGRAAGPRC